jgi:hypothetical protein
MNLTDQDIAGIAGDLELAASLLRKSGLTALLTTEAWIRGPRSANLDQDTRGWRWETIIDGNVECVVPVPADSTGEAILTPDLVGVHHGHLLAAVRFVAQAAPEVIRIVRLACPDPTKLHLVAEDLTDTQVSAEGWCVSCWRDGGYREPVAVQPDGRRRYRDLCLWCGRFAAAHDDKRPPLSLVKARREGRRITERMVADALAAEEAERREERKKNRKKKTKR